MIAGGFACCFSRAVLFLAGVVGVLWQLPANGQPFTNTATVVENQKPGTTAWQITKSAVNSEIEGYASLTSVNRGGQIKFFVNTTNSTFALEIFRVGWYGGSGGRRVFGPVTLPGSVQPIPAKAAGTGLIECNWTNPYTLSIPATPGDPTDWPSGAYLAKLTGGQDGKQSYMIFAVRDDTRPADLLFQMSFTTYQAYNTWGGVSLYGGANIVSFNRPYITPTSGSYGEWKGSGDFWQWECNLLRWLEREGYDVAYCSSVDTHAITNLLWNHQAFLSVGHDEYWSNPMRSNVKAARDRGVNLAFLSSNTSFWQVRFQPSTIDGAVDRNLVCYKSTADPVYNSPSNYLTTVQFRAAPVLDPESSLLGVYFDFAGVTSDLVVNDPNHWIFAGTGVAAGQRLPGLLGYEVDSTNRFSPPGIQVACVSPYLGFGGPANPVTSYSDAASYTTASGATVFAAGTMQWSWGLDDLNSPGYHASSQSPVVQHMTRNLMARMMNQPAPSPNFFFRLDTTTVGNWKPLYGVEGYCLPNDATNLPAYATLSASGATQDTYLAVSNDAKSVRRAASVNGYLAGWSSSTNFVLDLNLSDGTNHLVALYFCDWNRAGRTQMVEVLEAGTAKLLDRQIVGGFTNGQWWSWQINGRVQFRFTNLAGPDCVVNALMLGGGGAATFVCEDSVSQGNWKPFYGADGQALVGGATRNPAYGTIAGQGTPTSWSFAAQDPRAYELYGTTNRAFGSVGFQGASDVFHLRLTDDAWHQLAVYCVDGDRSGRKEILTLIDANNNKVLDTRMLTNYHEGKYVVWNIRGSVRLHFQNAGPYSSAVSGILLGPPNQGPAVSITAPTHLQEFNLPTNIVLSAEATDADDAVTQVTFLTNGVPLVTVTNSPFTFVWSNAVVGRYDITAMAVDSRRANTTSGITTIFVDPPTNYQTPSVRVTSPASGATVLLPTNLVISASVAWTSAPVVRVQFHIDGVPFGPPQRTEPFTAMATNLYAGTHSIRAVALDAFGVVVTSPGVTLYTAPPTPVTNFRDGDPMAGGAWTGRYGSDGYVIINFATNLPPYALVGPMGNDSQVWAASTIDARALKKPAASDRFAGAWCTYTNCSLDVNFVDGNSHRVTLYCLDWYNQSAPETIQVVDADSNAVLDSRTISNFNNGLYLVWDLVGHVRFRFNRTGGQLASVTGVFFDPPRTLPQVNLFAPVDGSSAAFPTNVLLSAYAVSGLTNLSRVEFRANGTLLGVDSTGSPYTFLWTNPPSGTYSLTARAVDANGTSVTSPATVFVVESSSAFANFVSSDDSHQGTWRGTYGTQGYIVAGDSTNVPAYLNLNQNSQLLTWASFTVDPRAMQRDLGDDRVAAAWYGYSNVVIDVKFTDATYHRVSLYCLNWFGSIGTQTVDVIDNVSGAVLDHEVVPSFSNGVYETWDIKGHVRFLVSRTGVAPAYVSAIFLDPSGILPPISITDPISQSAFVAPANIAVIADASPDPQNVVGAEFYDGATLLGMVTNGPPYIWVWTNAPAGLRSVHVREVGPRGSVVSAPVVFSVLGTNKSVFVDSTLVPGVGFQMQAFGPPDKPLILEYTTNLGPAAVWKPLMTNVAGDGKSSFTVGDPTNYSRRFYRITVAP